MHLLHLPYVLVALALLPWMLWTTPEMTLLQPDSSSYMSFDSVRSAGYPVFIDAVQRIGIPIAKIGYPQVALFVLSLLFLGYALASTTSSWFLSALAVFAAGGNPILNQYHFVVLTESIFVSATVAICAAIVLSIYAYRERWIWLLAGLIGLAVVVRPVGYAFVPVLLLVAVAHGCQRELHVKRFLLAALLPVVAFIGLERAAHWAYHGEDRSSLMGLHLFAKAGMVEAPTANPYSSDDPRSPVWQALEHDLEPVRRVIREAPEFGVRLYLLTAYEVFTQYRFGREVILPASRQLAIPPPEVMQQVGLARLAQAPMAYVWLVWQHYRGLWTLYAASHPSTSKAANAYIQELRPLPLVEPDDRLNAPVPASRLARFVQPVFLAVWLTTLAVPIAALVQLIRRRALSPELSVTAILALMINGNFLLVALFGVSTLRYTIAMWPAMVVFGLLVVWRAWGMLRTAG